MPYTCHEVPRAGDDQPHGPTTLNYSGVRMAPRSLSRLASIRRTGGASASVARGIACIDRRSHWHVGTITISWLGAHSGISVGLSNWGMPRGLPAGDCIDAPP